MANAVPRSTDSISGVNSISAHYPTIQSWVGRDSRKYVPGFYWLTLVPEALTKQHHVPLAGVRKNALEHIELEDGQHLFRFYERPEDWRYVSSVARLVSALPGLFNVERIKPQLPAAKEFLDLSAVIRKWK